jgi:hypothetical protein
VEAEVAEAAGGSVVAEGNVAGGTAEVGPVEQVAGKFEVVDEIAGVENAVEVETEAESGMVVALGKVAEGGIVEADVDC